MENCHASQVLTLQVKLCEKYFFCLFKKTSLFKGKNIYNCSIFLEGFLYHTAPKEDKLSPDDAKFVDVIHSAGLWLGTDETVTKLLTRVKLARKIRIGIFHDF